MKIHIRGEGIAAYCCALLLQRAGETVTLERSDRPGVPAILLSDTALALIRDVFALPDLLADQPRIERRVVAWGPVARPAVLPHSGIVVSEQALLAALRPSLNASESTSNDQPGFEKSPSGHCPPQPANTALDPGRPKRSKSARAMAATRTPAGSNPSTTAGSF